MMEGVSAANALLLSSSEEWYSLGQSGGITFANDFAAAVDGITSLLLIRIIAVSRAVEYDDLSTTCIATVIVNTGQGEWPTDSLSPSTVEQTKQFVTFILNEYQKVPFHNFRHAHHVVLCANKLLDQILLKDSNNNKGPQKRPPPTYGLRSDPTALLALVFAALVHDVGHPGVTNRQRVVEQDEMAIQYNDESIHENHALSVAFGELLKNDYGELRRTMFPEQAHYRYFRKLVIDTVLSTDLASPVRIQISRSKFQEAFPEQQLLGENNIIMWNDEADGNNNNGRRHSMQSVISKPRASKSPLATAAKNTRRGSTQSVSSVISDISTDSYALMRQQQQQQQHFASQPGLLQQPSSSSRRMSNQSFQSYDSLVSDYDSVHHNHHQNGSNGAGGGSGPKRSLNRKSSIDSSDSMLDYVEKALKGEPIRRSGARRASVEGTTSLSGEDLQQLAAVVKAERRQSLNDSSGQYSGGAESSHHGGDSLMAAESIDLAQKRRKGQGLSRFRSQHETSRPNLPGGKYLNNDDDDDDDEEDDLSLTPPSSDDEMQGVIITGACGKGTFNPAAASKKKMSRRRSSLANRRGSVSSSVFNIEEEDPQNMNDSSPDLAFEIEAKHNLSEDMAGLGIRRSIDLSGESIDCYSVRDSISVCSNGEVLDEGATGSDEPDEFKTSVVIELLLRVADVAYWFQSEELFVMYSSKLLQELVEAHEAQRGEDPRPKWVQNQLNMAQQYLAVLALQVQRTGIFGRNFDFWFPLPDGQEDGEWRFPSHVLVKTITALP